MDGPVGLAAPFEGGGDIGLAVAVLEAGERVAHPADVPLLVRQRVRLGQVGGGPLEESWSGSSSVRTVLTWTPPRVLGLPALY